MKLVIELDLYDLATDGILVSFGTRSGFVSAW